LRNNGVNILPDSPTQRVGASPSEKFEKVEHREPMLSLDNAFSIEELREFDARVRRLLGTNESIEYTVEPKYDGLAVELSYKNGVFLKRVLVVMDMSVKILLRTLKR